MLSFSFSFLYEGEPTWQLAVWEEQYQTNILSHYSKERNIGRSLRVRLRSCSADHWLWATRQAASSHRVCYLLVRTSPYLPMLIWGSFIHSFNKYLLSAIWVFYHCPNKLSDLKQHSFMIFHYIEVQLRFHWAKIKCQECWVLSGASKGELLPCLFQLLEATDSLACGPFLHPQSQKW